jgi:hypothetical protein
VLTTANFKVKGVVDGAEYEGEATALTIANAAPPFSVLAHGHVGECIYDDGKLEAIAYTASSSKIGNVVTMAKLFAGALFGDNPVKGEDVPWDIQGGRYKDIRIECDPPQKVVLDGELLGEWGAAGAGGGRRRAMARGRHWESRRCLWEWLTMWCIFQGGAVVWGRAQVRGWYSMCVHAGRCTVATMSAELAKHAPCLLQHATPASCGRRCHRHDACVCQGAPCQPQGAGAAA